MFTPSNQIRTNGFTLLEILLALFIFSLIIIGAYQISSIAQKSAVSIEASQKRLHNISLTFELLEKDFSQIVARSLRDPLSDALIPPLQTDYSDNYIVRFTRGGWRNPLGLPRSDLQAVMYRLNEENTLERLYTQQLDNISSYTPVETQLLDKVNSIQILYIDGQSGEPSENWPPQNTSSNNSVPFTQSGETLPITNTPLPVAVEVTLELEDMGVISKIIPLPAGA